MEAYAYQLYLLSWWAQQLPCSVWRISLEFYCAVWSSVGDLLGESLHCVRTARYF